MQFKIERRDRMLIYIVRWSDIDVEGFNIHHTAADAIQEHAAHIKQGVSANWCSYKSAALDNMSHDQIIQQLAPIISQILPMKMDY